MNLQEKAIEIAKKYERLPMRDKIRIIAQAFGCTSGKVETSLCYGKWCGTSDIFIRFDNGTADEIGGHMDWYYVTLAVDGKIRAYWETGLKYNITGGKVSEAPKREQYFTAGGLKSRILIIFLIMSAFLQPLRCIRCKFLMMS